MFERHLCDKCAKRGECPYCALVEDDEALVQRLFAGTDVPEGLTVEIAAVVTSCPEFEPVLVTQRH